MRNRELEFIFFRVYTICMKLHGLRTVEYSHAWPFTIVNVYCDPVCTVDDVCSVDVLRILTFGYNRGFLSTSRRSMVSVQNYIARKIGSEFESLDYILHRLENCTIFAIKSKHLKL